MLLIITKGRLRRGASEPFKKAIKPFIEASRTDEGNISYELFESVKNSDVVTFIARWEDETAFKKHNASPHFKQVVPKLLKFLRITKLEETTYKPVL
ncbi:antibiotic biosynthesis monooxygenase [Lachnospiraceae bacterium ZAX-1]